MMINNTGDVFKLCISIKKSKVLQPVKIKAKARSIDMRVIFHINAIFKRFKEVFNAIL